MVKVRWDTGDITWEPLDNLKKDDPLTLAQYAKDKDLTLESGWKWTKRFVKNPKKFLRYMRILKGQKRTGPKFKHGIQIPRNLREARELDRINGNNLWKKL